MPRLAEISRKSSQVIEVPSLPWLNRALNGGFVRGAVYLLAGGPALGKTTLVNQVLGDLAIRGRKVLYVTTEQSLGEFKAALERVHARGGSLPHSMVQNFFADDTVDDVGSERCSPRARNITAWKLSPSTQFKGGACRPMQ